MHSEGNRRLRNCFPLDWQFQKVNAGRSCLSNLKLSEAGERGISRRRPEILELPEVRRSGIKAD